MARTHTWMIAAAAVIMLGSVTVAGQAGRWSPVRLPDG